MRNEQTNDVLQRLMKCIAACEHCADSCLNEKDPGRMAQCVRLDRDCADICTLTARFIARDSSETGSAIELCTALCQACEEECRQHDHDHCRACAEACRECREACEEYVTTAA